MTKNSGILSTKISFENIQKHCEKFDGIGEKNQSQDIQEFMGFAWPWT